MNQPSNAYVENHTIRQQMQPIDKAKIDEDNYKLNFFNSIRWDILKNIKV